MNENETKKSNQTLVILGLIALIAVLFIGVKLIFAGLGAMLPREEASRYTMLADENSQNTAYGVRLLTEEEIQTNELQTWLDSAREWAGEGHAAFWLCRTDEEEYVLYLPEQDRTLSAADITATEEKDGDGEITLVLRIRTPEDGTEVAPEEQLFSFKTQSERWRGIRLNVILDGREKDVCKLASKGGKLYSTEELYIGRDID